MFRSLLRDFPEIVVGTPAKVLALINCKNLILDELKFLVIDEADLVFSFGFEEDTKEIAKWVYFL